MNNKYTGVVTRFLHDEERFMLSDEHEMPLVIEATDSKDIAFLHAFVTTHAAQLLQDIAHYGAVLLRGFDVVSEKDFENTILSIQGLHGISDAFMSEEGRIHAGHSNFVLHTNAVYKTGGTLYLGGFHSENYYSPDVPGYICFACFEPSRIGGETGLINMKKLYKKLDHNLKKRLESRTFFVSKWLVSDVAKRYRLPVEKIEKICADNHLPIVGKGRDKMILMYKPSVFENPLTQEKSLQINLFEIYRLNKQLRQCFMSDYATKEWRWHRFFWKLPRFLFKPIKLISIVCFSFFYSPRDSFQIFLSKIRVFLATNKNKLSADFDDTRAGSCFGEQDVKDLAKLIRSEYSSCLWKKGDILLLDNKQVVHAGMPGAGPRVIRAMICNPLEMKYSDAKPGFITCHDRDKEAIGVCMTNAYNTI